MVTALTLTACGGDGGGGSVPTPVAVSDSYVVENPGATRTFSAPGVLQNDIGSSLTAQLVSYSGANGTLTFNTDGSFTYTHNAVTSFTYRAVNGTGASAPVTVTIDVNQPPVASNACSSTPAGTSLDGTLTASDETDSQPVTFMQVVDATVGPYKGNVIVNANGTFTYTPTNGVFRGMDKFKFRATDRFGLTHDAIATVFIDGSIRIMPLGDSITQGVWYAGTCNPGADGNCPAPGVRVAYREKLYNDLEALSPAYGVRMVGSLSNGADAGLTQPNHEGHPGFRDDEIATNVNSYLTGNPPDIILLHIGTNAFDTSAADVNTLLNNINSWTQSYFTGIASGSRPVTVFVARIIESVDGSLDVNTFNTNVASIAGNRANVRVSMVNQQIGAGLTYGIDTSPTCLGGGTCSGDMADNLHPNPSGYRKMADKWKTDLIATSGLLPSCP